MQLNIVCWLILICHLYAESEVPSCIPKAFFFTLSCIIYFSVYTFNKIRCLSGGPVSLNVFFS